MSERMLKVAIIDLNNNIPNLGLKSIEKMVMNYEYNSLPFSLEYKIFDLRHKNEIPDTNYDIYISSGGPGSPFEGENSKWEKNYFKLIKQIWTHNKSAEKKKYFLFICHSYQLMCRYFGLGEITKRKSMSFGIKRVYKIKGGVEEPCFNGLSDPFYVADFRDYQVINPNLTKLKELGGEILCLEKPRKKHKQRAIMGIRLSNEFLGTQFHPEAYASGMKLHFQTKKKEEVDY